MFAESGVLKNIVKHIWKCVSGSNYNFCDIENWKYWKLKFNIEKMKIVFFNIWTLKIENWKISILDLANLNIENWKFSILDFAHWKLKNINIGLVQLQYWTLSSILKLPKSNIEIFQFSIVKLAKSNFLYPKICCWKGQILWSESGSSNCAGTRKVDAALQTVFFGTHLNGRRAAIRLPIMLKP